MANSSPTREEDGTTTSGPAQKHGEQHGRGGRGVAEGHGEPATGD